MPILFVIIAIICAAVAVYSLMHDTKPDPDDLEKQVRKAQKKYTPEMNRYKARKETKAATARADMFIAINKEAAQATEAVVQRTNLEAAQFAYDHVEERNWRMENAEISNTDTLIAENDLKQHLITQAKRKELDVASYVEWQKKLLFDKADLDKQWEEIQQKLKGAFIYEMSGYQHLELMTKYIHQLYEQSRTFEGEGKDREKKLIEEHINFMEDDFRERQRLVQTGSRRNLGSSDQDTESGRDGSETAEATQEQVPSEKRGRGRPRGSTNK